ncbi:Putative hemolysin [Arcticibacter svalbardensis MN12-7]|uniref:Putative hemolysin n=1 Tax=Arcticibacter svalbardensis MN12-7 TaxID=1150600 RepID=R9GXA3_9SPHI|nr:GNAT family N-acyltransferase [Arcticibacter svalbardensis]EOR93589.1 Putative hemolysin [Arcticibacter svalbardensis MN12-7]
MAVVSKEDFSKTAGINSTLMPGLDLLLMKIMKINDLNEIIDQAESLQGPEFAAHLLHILGIAIELDPADLANIPKDGAFIAIANHPYGAIEALALLQVLTTSRPETMFMGNFLLKRIPNLADYIIPVNPFEKIKDKSSITGLKNTIQMLKNGTPVAIFPAGEVSAYTPGKQQITDKKWHPVVGKIISKANVPVLPIYFHGNNGILFSLLRYIHPMLQTAKLPSELFNKRGHVLRIRIGKPVTLEQIPGRDNNTELLNYLRVKTYALGAGLANERKILNPGNIFKIRSKSQLIVEQISPALLEKEVTNLNNQLICREKNYEVYLASSAEIPNLLKEIGRLRETTFREVGEGSNKSIDLDKFDIYYYHLFIWDHENKLLVGAYRIGKGDEIFYSMGKKGFYTAELFKIKKEFYPILKESLELGRSWIRKEYQQKPLPLYLLWKGLLKYLQTDTRYKYLIGPVSISNKYSRFSKSLMVEYIMKHHFNHDLAKHIKPYHHFRVNFSKLNQNLLLDNCDSLKDLNSLISELETSHIKIPVLLRQYLALQASFIGFNIDPKFSDCLDGFLVLNLTEVPQAKIDKLTLTFK